MKYLLICFLALSFTNTPKYIQEYHDLSGKEAEQTFIKRYEQANDVNIQAYVVSLKMKQAKYKLMPWSKLKVFNREKKQLEKLILDYPNNIHLRYVRLVIQENLPSILNYNSNVKEDKKFLKEVLTKNDSTSYLNSFIIKNTSL